MASQDEISVIIPAYNAQNCLARAVNGVFRQTKPPHEIIVVDDGSTDDTPAIVKALREKVIYIREPKPSGGPPAPRNRGIQKSSGKWIAFLDQDDEWEPEHLELQHASARQTGADLVFCDARVQGMNERWPSWMDKVGLNPRFSATVRDNIVADCFENLLTIGNFISPSTVLVKRSCLLETGLFDTNLPGCEDYDLWLRLALKYRFAFAFQKSVVRWEHGSNFSGRALTMIESILKLWCKLERTKQVTENPKWRREVKRKRTCILRERGRLQLHTADTISYARDNFARSFRDSPTVSAAIFWLATLLRPVWLDRLRIWRRRLVSK